jgi:hypothetical protein
MKVEAQPDYVETVPKNVWTINEDRVRVLHSNLMSQCFYFPLTTASAATNQSPTEENPRSRGFYSGGLKGNVRTIEIERMSCTRMYSWFPILYRIILMPCHEHCV